MNSTKKQKFKCSICCDDINKYIFVNGLMGKITDLKNGDLYIIPQAKAFYKKIIIDEINETYKIFYKYKPEEMKTIKINNIFNKVFYIINDYSFNDIILCIKYNEEPDILHEIIETDEEADKEIFKTNLINAITKYIKDDDKTTMKQQFKNKFFIYNPEELKVHLSDLIFKWGFSHQHYKILNDAINDIYNIDEQPEPIKKNERYDDKLYLENYILY
jgi:hypothetical protein